MWGSCIRQLTGNLSQRCPSGGNRKSGSARKRLTLRRLLRRTIGLRPRGELKSARRRISCYLGGSYWLGGRDSNPDTVVQRSVHAVSSAPVRAFSRRLSRTHLRGCPSVSLRSCAV